MEIIQVIKVPQGLWKAANDKNILTDVLFYYQLKCLNQQGSLKKDEIISSVKSEYKYSTSSIYRKIDNLIKLGFAFKDKAGTLMLRKYDVIWSFTLDRSITSIQQKGAFKLFKIDKKHINNIEYYIALNEIKFNFCKQNHQRSSDTEKNKKASNIALTNEGIDFLKQQGKDYSYYNSDISISCEGVANLLGYTSASKGYELEQGMKKLGLIDIQQRNEIYDFALNKAEFLSMGLIGGFFFSGGVIYKVLNNLFSFLI